MMSLNQAKSKAAFALAKAEKFQPQHNEEWNLWLKMNESKIMSTALDILDQELTDFNAARGIQQC